MGGGTTVEGPRKRPFKSRATQETEEEGGAQAQSKKQRPRRTVREVATRRLRLDAHAHVNIFTLTCTNPLIQSEEMLTRAALHIKSKGFSQNRNL